MKGDHRTPRPSFTPEPVPQLFAGPRISRITIGRLHNLGNYEHVRFEVTVELPPGTSPASVIGELSRTLDDMDPKSPVDAWELKRALDTMKEPAPTLRPTDAGDPFDDPQGDLNRALRQREEATRNIAKHEAWRKSHEAALARFDQFGGSSQRGGGMRDDFGDEQQ